MRESTRHRLGVIGFWVAGAALVLLVLAVVLNFREAGSGEIVNRVGIFALIPALALTLMAPDALHDARPLWARGAPLLERFRALLLVLAFACFVSAVVADAAGVGVLGSVLVGLRWLAERPASAFDDLTYAGPEGKQTVSGR